MNDLFDGRAGLSPSRYELASGALVLPGLASPLAGPLLAGLLAVAEASPFRRLVTRGGATMSVAMTNCGALGWIGDRSGYRYTAQDPLTGRPWPEMPAPARAVAAAAASQAGYGGFAPNACLVNRYEAGAKLSLHRDRDELDLSAPIVSISLGLPATFLFGGPSRADPVRRVRLAGGDVVVWGGASRLAYHGVAPLAAGDHRQTGGVRYNLTFRTVGGPLGRAFVHP